MNAAGETDLPSVRIQRAKASAPTIAPVARDTFGWNHGLICPAARARRICSGGIASVASPAAIWPGGACRSSRCNAVGRIGLRSTPATLQSEARCDTLARGQDASIETGSQNHHGGAVEAGDQRQDLQPILAAQRQVEQDELEPVAVFEQRARFADASGAGDQEAGPCRRVRGDGAIEALVIDDQKVLAPRHSVQVSEGGFDRRSCARDEGGQSCHVKRFGNAGQIARVRQVPPSPPAAFSNSRSTR